MLRQDTSAKGVVRRFIASAAASVQSRKKVRLLGRAPSEAEISHGKILTARFSSPIGVGSGTGDDNHSRIRQLTEINNVWTAEANVKLCPGCPRRRSRSDRHLLSPGAGERGGVLRPGPEF